MVVKGFLKVYNTKDQYTDVQIQNINLRREFYKYIFFNQKGKNQYL